MSGWLAAAQAAMQIGETWMQSSSQHKANRTNIKLQREQQAWEERMSNTAIQRHADDIEKAGGNRALAFVNGQQASTPTVTPARVEAPDYKGIGAGVMSGLTAAQMAANTKKILAEARITNVEADIREAGKEAELQRRVNREVEEYEWDDIKTKLLRNSDVSSAAEAKRLRETVDTIIQQTKQALEKGDLEVKQLRNIVNVGGLAPEDRDSIMRYLIDVLFRGK